MKMITRIAAVATLATFMFAGMNITWGNNYSDTNGSLGSTPGFGVWFDVNDATTVGWENGLKIGLAGPAGMTFRLGYDATTSLGVGRSWWTSTGDGWGTNLSTAIDWTMTGAADEPGEFALTMNLGFGF